jgi:plasmid stabilization system protein ParE
MVRGSKGKYTAKQKREARHIEKGYEERGTPRRRAEAIAWATVNARTGGGRLGGRLAKGRSRPSHRKKSTASPS